MSDLNDQFLKKQRKELEQKQLANAPSTGQPSVDSIHDILVELGLEASVDGIDKQMYLNAKSQLLAHALSCLPEKMAITKPISPDDMAYNQAHFFNTALDLMEQKLRASYE